MALEEMTVMENISEFLKNIDLFSLLSDKEIEQITNKLTVKKFKKDEVILQEEDTNEYMYIILSGKVKVIQIKESGKEIIIALHQSGDFFGEVSLIDGRTAPAMVLSTEDSVIALISKKDFFSLLYSQTKVLDILLQILCTRLRESWDRIQILSFNNASDRVKMLLILLSNEYGNRTKEGIKLNIKLTHQEIADMAGIARETVTRIIDKWIKDGDLEMKERLIFMSNGFIKNSISPSV